MNNKLQITGYASRFGEPDFSGDIVRPGAFAASLLSLGGRALPMLFGHDTKNPIGVWSRLVEDERGLFVGGEIIGGTPRADRAIHLIKAGAIRGLSIGYRPVRAQKQTKGRALYELDLWEVSVVAFPMLRSAQITQIGGQSPQDTGSQAAA